jgi:hypothetical protein
MNAALRSLLGWMLEHAPRMYGVFHSVSEASLHRYLAEFHFRYSSRPALGVEDAEGPLKPGKVIAGKRLTHNRPEPIRARRALRGLRSSST